MAQHVGMGGQPDAGGEAGKGAAGVVATAGSTCSVSPRIQSERG